MSLPPGFLDELRDRLTLSAVVGRKVMWDRRKTNQARGDFWAPCPFHQEKTPSFHVDDRKGFYYCFGCQAKGDAITFVKDTENVSFIEAVEILAREAGMQMPEQRHDPEAAERQDRRARLAEVMEQAVQMYGLAFRSGAGQGARDYALRRGLTEPLLKRFEIGFAPDSRTHQTGLFRDKGILEEAVAAGLVIRPEDGSAPYDRFRNRLMFPIRDPRGRCIAFGGRALDPNAQAKYLNSPETELFHKGRTLYNHGPAREAAAKAGTLIVAEGYMDVIALSAAGFENAVAPLGTAVTEDQLQLIWRIAEEPIVALDGDEAGLRAAERLVDLALPMLAPGRSLRFCLLPEGRDPDDLIRAEGPGAMAKALDDALPLAEMLWLRETRAQPLDTPERRAALDRRLREALKRIGDESVRNHYAADIKARRAELFRPAPHNGGAALARFRGGANNKGRQQGTNSLSGPTTPETRKSDLARSGGATSRSEARRREAGILLTALLNLDAAAAAEIELEEMKIVTMKFIRIRDALLSVIHDDGPANKEEVAIRLGFDPVKQLSSIPEVRKHPLTKRGVTTQHVESVLREAIAIHHATLAYEEELSEAARDLDMAEGEDWTWRVRQARHHTHELHTAALKDDETEVPEGIQELRDALGELTRSWDARKAKKH